MSSFHLSKSLISVSSIFQFSGHISLLSCFCVLFLLILLYGLFPQRHNQFVRHCWTEAELVPHSLSRPIYLFWQFLSGSVDLPGYKAVLPANVPLPFQLWMVIISFSFLIAPTLTASTVVSSTGQNTGNMPPLFLIPGRLLLLGQLWPFIRRG